MRGRSSSRSTSRISEVERAMLKEEPQLSGAFIRSLVKHLTSSRSKETSNPDSPNGDVGDRVVLNSINSSEAGSEKHQQQPQDSASRTRPKKQTRRRLHSSRPYQQRVLNMAEARREIVAALKLHRASIKLANEQQQLRQQLHQQGVSSSPSGGPYYDLNYRRNTRIYPPTTNISFDCFQNTSYQSFSHSPLFPVDCTAIPQLPIIEPLGLTLPSQPLGLNLNLHDFENIEVTFKDWGPVFNSSCSPSTITSSSSSSYSCSSFVTAPALEVPSILFGPVGMSEATLEPTLEPLHPAMDDKEIAEIQSIGEKHDMEWNDKLNLAQSAWWSKLLTTIETDSYNQEERIAAPRGDEFELHDELMDVLGWLPDQQQLADSFVHEDYFHDAALPCLDHTGEIKGIEGEWLL